MKPVEPIQAISLVARRVVFAENHAVRVHGA